MWPVRTILASDTNVVLAQSVRRASALITNTGSSTLFVLLGDNDGTPSATKFTRRLAAGEWWQVPAGYQGPVTAEFSGAGEAVFSEFDHLNLSRQVLFVRTNPIP